MILWRIPNPYPAIIIIINTGLFPITIFVRKALIIEMGQLQAKQINISTSKKFEPGVPIILSVKIIFLSVFQLLNSSVIAEKKLKFRCAKLQLF